MNTIDDETKASILYDLNDHSRSRKLYETLSNAQGFAYCDGYIDAVKLIIKALGYTYYARINQKLECIVYTDIVREDIRE